MMHLTTLLALTTALFSALCRAVVERRVATTTGPPSRLGRRYEVSSRHLAPGLAQKGKAFDCYMPQDKRNRSCCMRSTRICRKMRENLENSDYEVDFCGSYEATYCGGCGANCCLFPAAAGRIKSEYMDAFYTDADAKTLVGTYCRNG